MLLNSVSLRGCNCLRRVDCCSVALCFMNFFLPLSKQNWQYLHRLVLIDALVIWSFIFIPKEILVCCLLSTAVPALS